MLLNLICTSTIIEITDVATIEELLLQALVDFVMYMTRPCCSCGPRGDLRRKFGKNLSEVCCAFAAVDDIFDQYAYENDTKENEGEEEDMDDGSV